VDPGAEYLPVDRYCVNVGGSSPVEIRFDIPAPGWFPYVPTSDFANLLNGQGWGLSFIEIDNLYADPCQSDDRLLDPPIGPAPDDLLAALGEQPAYEMTDPEEVTVGGYAGLQVDISVSDKDTGCTADGSWGVAPSGFGTAGSMNPEPGRPVRLWTGDVDGTRLVMVRPLSPLTDQRAEDLLELDAIVESLRFND
jgi:hypothetical protein